MNIKIEAKRHKDDHHMSEDQIDELVEAASTELRDFIKSGSSVARDKSFKKEYDLKWLDPSKGKDKEIDGQEKLLTT